MVMTKTMATLGYVRLAALIKNGVQMEVLENLMEDEISSIWLKVNKKGGRKMIIGGIYREHSLLRQPLPNTTDSEFLQNMRWERFINQWVTASQNADCYIVGDTNLDHLKWLNPDQINTVMTNMVKNTIETLGYHQLIRGATRFWPTQSDSLIDKCWTNCPEKILSASNIRYGASDHNIVEILIKMKGKIGCPKDFFFKYEKLEPCQISS